MTRRSEPRRDELAQIHLLRDALHSGSDRILVEAFLLVAWLRGLKQLAAAAGCDSREVFEAVSDREAPDMPRVRAVVQRIVGQIPENGQKSPAK